MKHTKEKMILTGKLRYYNAPNGWPRLQQEFRYNDRYEWRIVPHIDENKDKEYS